MSALDYPNRVRAGMVLLLLIAVFSCLDALRVNRWTEPSEVPVFEDRVRVLHGDLPSHGTVGYIGDEVPPNAEQNPHFHEFFHMQFVLAPITLVDSPGYPLVVGYFHAPIDPDRMRKLGLVVTKNYGDGVMLLRSANR